MTFEKQIAEQATGLPEHPRGSGQFYFAGGATLTDEQARTEILNDAAIEVPNAGAGSYREVFQRLGFKDVQPFCLSSSAGDWNFAVHDGESWRAANQFNRHPYHGFSYNVYPRTFDTKEACFEWMNQ